MDAPGQQGDRRGALGVAAVALLFLIAGVVVASVGLRGSTAALSGTTSSASVPSASTEPRQQDPRAGPRTQDARPDKGADLQPPDVGRFLPGSPPIGLRIPNIGVHAANIVDLGLAADGSLQVPRDGGSPGWFTPGPTPGQLGPAVIAGHLDSDTGPAVFYRLGELGRGDRIEISRQDGTLATFVVHRTRTFEKNAFPTRAVYGTTNRAELRLITCSGEYDSDTGYLSNTVVFAHLV